MEIKIRFTEEERRQLANLVSEYTKSDQTVDEFRTVLKPLFEPKLPEINSQNEKEQIDIDQLLNIVLDQLPGKRKQPPYRVRVMDGHGQNQLGEGTYVGDAMVWAAVGPDGTELLSNSNDATQPPENVPPGFTLTQLGNNPKIVLDDGRVVYGCQVWWEESAKQTSDI